MGHVWLIGMMGTGKTTVGAIVAERLERPFIDIDTQIMTTTGKTIPELFDAGEQAFRAVESQAVALASAAQPSVISTGGGAILATANLDLMKATGVTVLLTAPVETIMDRIAGGNDRPLAPDHQAVASIAELRRETYLAAADHAVDTVGLGPVEVAEEVMRCVVI